jgi:hypothetical protein
MGRGRLFELHPQGWVDVDDVRQRVLAVTTSTTKYPAFTYLPANLIYSNTLCVLTEDREEMFAFLSSDVHSIWAWAQKTTRQMDMESMRYAHGNIFETIPFPDNFLEGGDEQLRALGREFFSVRQRYMEDGALGLTAFYNAFNRASEKDGVLERLRQLQCAINGAVLSRYGWSDFDPECGFHEVAYLPTGKNTRFTFSEQSRAEILRRLLEWNQERSRLQDTQLEGPENCEQPEAPPQLLGDLFSAGPRDDNAVLRKKRKRSV